MEINLQFFAGGDDKTEPATPKKLEDARKEGQVSKSREVGMGLSLLGLFVALKFYIGTLGERFVGTFQSIYTRIPEFVGTEGTHDSGAFLMLLKDCIVDMLIMMAPFLLVGVVIAFVADVVQVKWKFTTKPLMPKFDKMNPIKGMKKIISAQSVFELLKAVLKVFFLSYLAISTVKDKLLLIYGLYDITLMSALGAVGEVIIDLGIKISAWYMVIAAVDFVYQKMKFKKDMRMSKQEVKDEYKNAEGDPKVKSQQKQRMRQASQRRMMQSIPTADVVITNPTHFAVALKYDADSGRAPIVVAKGEDFLAKRIKEIAKENKVEIVENKPLARMLYHNVDLGEEIPPELYQAVAEVLAFVYGLKNK
ncbi:MAG: flagellar biosynthesis protein FlhB [Lachnospiraceae bacterium]|nr:flagellar biosynthesis protein FlhB [Lachnospiraceae bacterium]